MGFTTLYYFIAFVLFFVCLGGIQKWYKLPQQKKDKVGLIVLVTFLNLLIVFILICALQPNLLSADTTASLMILFLFLIIVFTAFFIKWYNDKYKKTVNIGTVVIFLCLSLFSMAFIFLWFGGSKEKNNIEQNVALKTLVINITFDTHKPYFKNMTLADGQYLPMPEAMNNELQIGDSIYKIKGDNFYSVVSFKTKIKKQYFVATHLRVLSKPK